MIPQQSRFSTVTLVGIVICSVHVLEVFAPTPCKFNNVSSDVVDFVFLEGCCDTNHVDYKTNRVKNRFVEMFININVYYFFEFDFHGVDYHIAHVVQFDSDGYSLSRYETRVRDVHHQRHGPGLAATTT